MQLSTICKYCKKEILVKYSSNTRPELRQEIGETSKHHCSSCNQTTQVHVNQINANPSKSVVIFGVGLGVLFSLIVILIFGFITSIIFAIPYYVYHSQQTNAKLFNAYRVRSYQK